MNRLALGLALIGGAAFASSEVLLQPGTHITLTALEDTLVRCVNTDPAAPRLAVLHDEA